MTLMSDGTPVTPERDARIIADLRAWRESRHMFPMEPQRVYLTVDELDALLRASAGVTNAGRPTTASTPAASTDHPGAVDGAYVVRECGQCGHAPHGIGMICWSLRCGCRG